MKYYKHIITVIILGVFLFPSCEPRIDMDLSQWGDHAIITDVQLFYINQEDQELQEYYENGELTTGIRRIFYSTTSVIDEESASVIVQVPAGTDLTNVGLVIRNEAEKIIPVGNAPACGYLNDFSNGPYTYQLISADGTKRDWTISFVVV